MLSVVFAVDPSATFKIVRTSLADNISGTPALAVVRPIKLSVAIFANFASVTFASVILSAMMAFVANVVVIEIPADPSKLAVPVTSPATAIARVVANIVAVSAFPVTSPVNAPANPVAVKIPVLELNVKFVPDLGARFPLAAVVNNTLHDVSDDSSATVTVVAIAAVPVVS